MKLCPACKKEIPDNLEVCPFCNVIIKKWHRYNKGKIIREQKKQNEYSRENTEKEIYTKSYKITSLFIGICISTFVYLTLISLICVILEIGLVFYLVLIIPFYFMLGFIPIAIHSFIINYIVFNFKYSVDNIIAKTIIIVSGGVYSSIMRMTIYKMLGLPYYKLFSCKKDVLLHISPHDTHIIFFVVGMILTWILLIYFIRVSEHIDTKYGWKILHIKREGNSSGDLNRENGKKKHNDPSSPT